MVLIRIRKGKRPLGRSRHRWDDNRMALREVGLKVLTEISGSKYGQVAGCCEHGNEPTSYTEYL